MGVGVLGIQYDSKNWNNLCFDFGYWVFKIETQIVQVG